jgi:hypothetical protein
MGKSIKTNALIGEYFWENNKIALIRFLNT